MSESAPRGPLVEQLRDLAARFTRQADEGRELSAVVVRRPDLRDLAAERLAAALGRSTLSGSMPNSWAIHDPAAAMSRHVCTHFYLTTGGWSGCIYGPRRLILPGAVFDRGERAVGQSFMSIAADAARLILNGDTKAKQSELVSRWLIDLADRPEPLEPESAQLVLDYLALPVGHGGDSGHAPWLPRWRYVSPEQCQDDWWAVEIKNVFRLSALAVAESVVLAGTQPTAPHLVGPLSVQEWGIVLGSGSRNTAGTTLKEKELESGLPKSKSQKQRHLNSSVLTPQQRTIARGLIADNANAKTDQLNRKKSAPKRKDKAGKKASGGGAA